MAALIAFFGTAGVSATARADDALDNEIKQTHAQLMRNPGNIELTYKYAQLMVKAGDFEGAVSALEGLLLINPNQPRLRLEIGVLYLRMGNYATAKAYLQRALESPDVPADIRTRIEAYIGEIDKRAGRHSFTGSITTGMRYETNANLAPESSTIVLRGVEAFNSVKRRDDFSAIVSGRFVHTYDFKTNDETTWVTTGVGYFSRYARTEQSNILLGEVTSGPRFCVVQGTSPGLYVRPYVTGNLIGVNDEFYGSAIGGGVDVSMPYGDRWAFEATYQGRWLNYEDISVSPSASLQTGYDHMLRGRAGVRVDSDLTLLGELSGRYKDAKVKYYDYYEIGIAATATWDYPAPFNLTQRRWNVTGSVGYYHRDYQGADPAVHPTSKRREDELRLGLANIVRLDDHWMVVQQVDYMIVTGNLSTYDRNDFAVTLGVRYRF
ncbi:MAG: tetratricopeptide repeat protein [Alphaproteobacteria bacterium]